MKAQEVEGGGCCGWCRGRVSGWGLEEEQGGSGGGTEKSVAPGGGAICGFMRRRGAHAPRLVLLE